MDKPKCATCKHFVGQQRWIEDKSLPRTIIYVGPNFSCERHEEEENKQEESMMGCVIQYDMMREERLKNQSSKEDSEQSGEPVKTKD